MKNFLDKVWDFLEEIGKARASRHIKFGWY